MGKEGRRRERKEGKMNLVRGKKEGEEGGRKKR